MTDESNRTNLAAVVTQSVSRRLMDIRSGQMHPFPEVCDGEAAQGWTGRQLSAAIETELLKASGVGFLRPVRPGEAISMDYQSDRLTIELDRADLIIAMRCG